MAVISITVADAFDTRCNTVFGGNQAKKDAVKAYLINEVRNAAIRDLLAAQQAETDAAVAAIVADPSLAG